MCIKKIGLLIRRAFVFWMPLAVLALGVYCLLKLTDNKIMVNTRPTRPENTHPANIYRILVMNRPPNIFNHKDAQHWGFETCQYSNCRMTFNKTHNATSDAVIFDGRSVGPKFLFTRPVGQVWIFAEDESPIYYTNRSWKRPPWSHSFNWTMTYDISNTDIYLPYGELRTRQTFLRRNYTKSALNKSADILWIASHCKTKSKRELFVSDLKKFMPVKILGGCGDKWNCGRHFIREESCYQILNTTYRFYLAFENSLCDGYITEKYFDNFNYDVILITRGGKKGEFARHFPKGTYISTDDFKSVETLANYLKEVSHSVKKYAELLKRKDHYYSVGYKTVYQRAMCDICKRMNYQDKYRKTIPDMYNHTFDKQPCRQPNDIKLKTSPKKTREGLVQGTQS